MFDRVTPAHQKGLAPEVECTVGPFQSYLLKRKAISLPTMRAQGTFHRTWTPMSQQQDTRRPATKKISEGSNNDMLFSRFFCRAENLLYSQSLGPF